MFDYLRKKQLTQLRREWADAKSWDREMSSVSCLYRLASASEIKNKVDDKTWNDLDMDSVFRLVDTTMTSVGQQYLYRKLRIFDKSANELEADYRVATRLLQDQSAREELQLCLRLLNVGDAQSVTKALFGDLEAVEFSKTGLIIWSVFSLLTIVFAFTTGGLFLFLLLPVIVANFSLSRYFEQVTNQITYVFSYLYNLISISQRIAGLTTSIEIPAARLLTENREPISRIRKRLKLIAVSQSHESLLVNNLMYFVNLVAPYDVIAYTFSIRSIIQELDVIRLCFMSIGSIDASISTASYIRRHSHLCNPVLVDELVIDLVDTYHPLLNAYVSNSFSTNERSALITGSNMAGKTTFIKTIGVNLVFARTLWICHATQAKLPEIAVFSSIKTEDGLEEGKSFYFSELERLREFLEMTEHGGNFLFLIDEIYRGTNTVERIAGAAAVLEKLAENSLVFVTTHDIELADFLYNRYQMWFFEETGNLDKPFDYKLKSGVCRTRNALKLMGNIGYPDSITEKAKRIVSSIEDKE